MTRALASRQPHVDLHATGCAVQRKARLELAEAEALGAAVAVLHALPAGDRAAGLQQRPYHAVLLASGRSSLSHSNTSHHLPRIGV